MNNQVTLQQAMDAFAKGNSQLGLSLLKNVADSGNPDAALFYGDALYRSGATAEASGYLKQCWENGLTGALHRWALLELFIAGKQPTKEHWLGLHKETSRGHVESILALLSATFGHCFFDYYVQVLGRIGTDLVESLGLTVRSESEAETEPEEDLLVTVCMENWNKVDAMEAKLLDKGIHLCKFEAVILPHECEYFKLRFSAYLKDSLVYDPKSGQPMKDPVRTSLVAVIMPEMMDWYTLELDRRLAILGGSPLVQGEPLNLLNYRPGQQYFPHYDGIVGEGKGIQMQLQDGGQRIKTLIAYLNDVDDGGATHFPKLAIKVRPSKGDVVLFHNADEKGRLLLNSYHAGEQSSHEKWIITKWIRERATRYGGLLYHTISKEK